MHVKAARSKKIVLLLSSCLLYEFDSRQAMLYLGQEVLTNLPHNIVQNRPKTNTVANSGQRGFL